MYLSTSILLMNGSSESWDFKRTNTGNNGSCECLSAFINTLVQGMKPIALCCEMIWTNEVNIVLWWMACEATSVIGGFAFIWDLARCFQSQGISWEDTTCYYHLSCGKWIQSWKSLCWQDKGCDGVLWHLREEKNANEVTICREALHREKNNERLVVENRE